MSQQELERAIEQAHTRGDSATLARLQERYRSSGFGVTRVSTEAFALTAGGERTTTRDAAQPPAAPTRSVPLAVRFANDSWRQIREWGGDGFSSTREVGYWLFGDATSSELRVHYVSPAAADGPEGGRDYVWFESAKAMSLEQAFAAASGSPGSSGKSGPVRQGFRTRCR